MVDIDNTNDSDSPDGSREREKGSKTKGQAKSKDLSHVPCKFFKVGSCTAGSSCPFSHNTPEPGQQKDVCTWFVKGNCKFGHKCALAHVLPGQSMSMDRRNKKAAQQAMHGGQSNGPKEKDSPAKGSDKPRNTKTSNNNGNLTRSLSGQSRGGGLLTGSTAPTRVLVTGARPPLPISKAVPAPAAPAPPLRDADFAALDFQPSETTSEEQHPPMSPDSSPVQLPTATGVEDSAVTIISAEETNAPPIPLSTPSRPLRFTGRHGTSPSVDFGPIGSPPRPSPSNAPRVNGFSPAISPRDVPQTSGFLSTSLGATRALTTNVLPSQRSISGPGTFAVEADVVEDDDMEELIPSSLTDLLTPGERNRRMSRTSTKNVGIISRANLNESRHGYSRSVPSQILLGDIESIWATPSSPSQFDPGRPQVLPGTASSHKSSSVFGGLSDDGLSPSVNHMLSPSNASAAFLPGLHYLVRNNARGISQQLQQPAVQLPENTRIMSSTTHLAPADSFAPSVSLAQHHTSRPIPPSTGTFSNAELLSPSTKALQTHAPGQSLPQGLAAGYSRIHAQPVAPNVPSPGMSGVAFSPGSINYQAQNPDWGSPGDTGSRLNGVGDFDQDVGGLSSMFSRLSYSAATRGTSPASAAISPQPSAAITMSRKPSGRAWVSHPLSSPLGGPVLTNDDDLFTMDEDK